MKRLAGIYAIVDAAEGDPLAQLEAVLAGGVRLIQYRAKTGVDREVAAAIHARVRSLGGIFIVNDDPGALACADGIHLGQEDLEAVDLAALRRDHPGKLVGISCPDPATARAAAALGADYLGVGAMYPTGSKTDAGPPIGAAGVRSAVEAVNLPVAAIGGIGLERIPEVRSTGAAMAAVITAISRSPNPEAAARALVEAWAR